jgi:xanthine dehydrogenase molybdenum-binding subunit
MNAPIPAQALVPEPHDVIGRSVKRTDLTDKVTGSARFTADFSWPGMLYGRIKRCEVAHARIRRIDASRHAARAARPRA